MNGEFIRSGLFLSILFIHPFSTLNYSSQSHVDK
jgi:hypothetical protein